MKRREKIDERLKKYLKKTVKWIWFDAPDLTTLTIFKTIHNQTIRIIISNYMDDGEVLFYTTQGEIWKGGITTNTFNWGATVKDGPHDSFGIILRKIEVAIETAHFTSSWYKVYGPKNLV